MPACMSTYVPKREYEIVFLDEDRYELCRVTRPFLSYGAALSWTYNNLDTYNARGARVEIGGI